MLALRGRNAAVLPSLSASCTSDGLDTRSARAHRANARASSINPSADLAGRATRLGLEVMANNPRQDFDQPGCQDGLRLTLTAIGMQKADLQIISEEVRRNLLKRHLRKRGFKTTIAYIRGSTSVWKTRIPARYAAAIGFMCNGAWEYISSVSFDQLDAFARFTETEIEGVSIFAVCHSPPGINRISPGWSRKRIGTAFAQSGNFSRSGFSGSGICEALYWFGLTYRYGVWSAENAVYSLTP